MSRGPANEQYQAIVARVISAAPWLNITGRLLLPALRLVVDPKAFFLALEEEGEDQEDCRRLAESLRLEGLSVDALPSTPVLDVELAAYPRSGAHADADVVAYLLPTRLLAAQSLSLLWRPGGAGFAADPAHVPAHLSDVALRQLVDKRFASLQAHPDGFFVHDVLAVVKHGPRAGGARACTAQVGS